MKNVLVVVLSVQSEQVELRILVPDGNVLVEPEVLGSVEFGRKAACRIRHVEGLLVLSVDCQYRAARESFKMKICDGTTARHFVVDEMFSDKSP